MYFLAITPKAHLEIFLQSTVLSVKTFLGMYVLEPLTFGGNISSHFTTSFTPYRTTTFGMTLYGSRLYRALNIFLIVMILRSISGTFSCDVA